MPTSAHRSIAADTLHVLAAAGKVLWAWGQAQGMLVSAAHSGEDFLLQAKSTLSIKGSPLDQACLSPCWSCVLQSLFNHNLNGARPCLNVLLPTGKSSHKQDTGHAACTDLSMHPFIAVKVMEGKEKGWMEDRLCTDCSGIGSWFNEENYSCLLYCCGFSLIKCWYSFKLFKETNIITVCFGQ